MKKIYIGNLFLFTLLLMFSFKGAAQVTEVTGVVKDGSGMPLPGVNVLQKNTDRGAVTDFDGNYSIAVQGDNPVLAFSSVGFGMKEFPVNGQSQINVVLEEDVSALDEIVVMGYSTQSRRDVTGAVSTVDAEDLEAVPAANFAQQLQGRAAGVQVNYNAAPGGGVSVLIRGIGSISGDNNPLYVIDGVPTQGDLNLLSPNDIESIQILKDASAASIYGSRASNGVVVITTKKGKIGATRISVDGYTGIQMPPNYDIYNTPQQNAEILWQGLRNSGQVSPETGNPVHPIYGSGENPVIPDYLIPVGAMEGDPRTDPSNYSNSIFDPEYGQRLNQITRTNKQGTDWYDVITDPAFMQSYNLSVSGGSENGNYALSAGYFDQKGILNYTSFTRYSLRINTKFNIKKNLRIGEDIQFTYADKVGTGGGEFSPIGLITNTSPLQPVYDIAGNFSGNRDYVLGGPNPLAGLFRNKDNHGYAPQLFGNIFAELDFLKNLTARTSLGIDYSSYNASSFSPLQYENYLANPKKAVLNVDNSRSTALTWSNTLVYSKNFNQEHDVSVLFGLESVTNKYRYFGAQKTGFAFEDLNYRYLDAGVDITNAYGSGTDSSLFSVFAKVDYTYKDKYLLSATIRRDASSRFAPNNRWGTFPAFSLGWRISDEEFMKDISFISDLKIRGGWGKTGNQNIDPYNQYNTYVSNLQNASYDIFGTSTSAVAGFRKFRIGNPEARWEAQTMTNAGIDLYMFENKLSFILDIYDRSVSDILLQVPIPATEGQNIPPAVNIGAMSNKGVDISLGYDGSFGSDWDYTVSANWSAYKNEVTQLYNENAFINGDGSRIGSYTRTEPGQAISSFYGYVLDGIFQDQNEADAHAIQGGNPDLFNQVGRFKFRDLNEDGVINDEDKTFIGNSIPDFSYGFNLNMSYKNFDLSVFLQGVSGNEIFNYTRYFTDFFGLSYNYGPNMLDSWTPNNRDAILPLLNPTTSGYESQPSTYYIEDGSYLRAKNIQLGYTFPKDLMANLDLSQFQIYLQGQNLFTVTKYSGIDPTSTYPNPLNILMGFKLSL